MAPKNSKGRKATQSCVQEDDTSAVASSSNNTSTSSVGSRPYHHANGNRIILNLHSFPSSSSSSTPTTSGQLPPKDVFKSDAAYIHILQNHISHLEGKLNERIENITYFKDREISDLKTHLENTNETTNSLFEDFFNAQKEFQIREKEYKAKLEKYHKEVGELEVKLGVNQRYLDQLRRSGKGDEHGVASGSGSGNGNGNGNGNQIPDLTEKYDEQLNNLKAVNEKLKKENEQLKKENERLKKDNERLRKENEQPKKRIEELETEMESSRPRPMENTQDESESNVPNNAQGIQVRVKVEQDTAASTSIKQDQCKDEKPNIKLGDSGHTNCDDKNDIPGDRKGKRKAKNQNMPKTTIKIYKKVKLEKD